MSVSLLQSTKVISIERTMHVRFLEPGGIDGYGLAFIEWSKAQPVDRRQPESIKMRDHQVGFQYFDLLELEVEVDGTYYHLNRDGNLSDESYIPFTEGQVNPSACYFPGGEILSMDKLPLEMANMIEEDYDDESLKRFTYVRSKDSSIYQVMNDHFYPGAEVL